MSPCRKRKTCSADDIDELMAEFRRLRDETQPIHNDLMALTPIQTPLGESGLVLRELQLMRTEMKQIQDEMKENFEQIRGEVAEVKEKLEVVKNQQQVLKEIQEKMRKNQDSVKESQEFVKNCLQEVKTSHVDLKKTVTDNAANLDILKTKIESVSTQIDKMTEKAPETNCLPTIKAQLPKMNVKVPKTERPPTFKERASGKWKWTGKPGEPFQNLFISLKFSDGRFILKWDKEQPHVYTWGVAHSDGWTAHLEGEKIVQLKPNYRREIYLENGRLVLLDKIPRIGDGKFTFVRVGDPDV